VIRLPTAPTAPPTAPMAGHAAPSNSFQREASSKYGVAVAGVGTRCLAIGAGGEADGFHTLRAEPLLRRMAALTEDGVPTALGKAPTEVGVQTAIGEAPTEVGTAGSSLPRA
jgi:hypothetical protein